MEQSKLSAPIKTIFLGVLIWGIIGIIYSVLAMIPSLLNIVLMCFKYFTLLGMIGGAVVVFLGLGKLKGAVADTETAAVGQIRLGYILYIVALGILAIFFFIPGPGLFSSICAGILTIIFATLLVMGYGKLKAVEIFNADMKGGFSILSLAAIFMIVAEGLDFIPGLNALNIVWAIFTISSIVITLIGWNKVKRGAIKA